MSFAAWSTFAGVLLVCMALAATLVGRLPISSAMVYLAIGAGASPLGLGITSLEALPLTLFLEHLAEAVVVLSLFTSGLKMGAGLHDGRWGPPVRLALYSMVVTVALVAAVAYFVLGLPLGAAVMLGAVLAPTDPVLASDVQVAHAGDRDRLRFALTGEAGLNDGTAFPFVMLGLGLMGFHELGAYGWRWLAVDVLWAVVSGLAIGAAVGYLVGHLVLYLRRVHREAVGLDEFLALGTIALAYGLSLQCAGYGFLAVFAAGFVLRQIERHETSENSNFDSGTDLNPDEQLDRKLLKAASAKPGLSGDESASDSQPLSLEKAISEAAVSRVHAPAFLARAMLRFVEQLESIGEVLAVLIVGMLLWMVDWDLRLVIFIAITLLVLRPLAVLIGLFGSRSSRAQRGLIAWFGIRGIGSLYYLMYAINHGLPEPLASDLTAITLSVIAVSIVAHGISVTPLITMYDQSRYGRKKQE